MHRPDKCNTVQRLYRGQPTTTNMNLHQDEEEELSAVYAPRIAVGYLQQPFGRFSVVFFSKRLPQ